MIAFIAFLVVLFTAIGLLFCYWDRLQGYRTVIWNLILAGGPTLAFILDHVQMFDWSQYLTPLNAMLLGIAIGVVGIWLRALSDTPIGEKEKE